MPDEKMLAELVHIRCRVIIEMLGKPKEHVDETINSYVSKIKNDSGFIVLNSEFADFDEKEGLWATFVELDMVIKGIPKLIAFCFDYMPSSIEILKPEEFIIKKSAIENLVNDLQARLHQVDMIIKKQKNENEFLRKNMNKSISNIILVTLANGSMDKENLSKTTGVHEKELEIFLDNLTKDNKIKKENDAYSLLITPIPKP